MLNVVFVFACSLSLDLIKINPQELDNTPYYTKNSRGPHLPFFYILSHFCAMRITGGLGLISGFHVSSNVLGF